MGRGSSFLFGGGGGGGRRGAREENGVNRPTLFGAIIVVRIWLDG